MKNKIILAVFLIVILLQAPCFCADSTTMQGAERLFLAGDFQAAANIYSQLQASKEKDKAAYMLALCYLKLKKPDEANELLSKLLSRTLSKDIEPQAQMAYADSFLMLDKPKEACAEYEKILQTNPKTNMISLVKFKLGEVSRKLGQWEKAKEYYKSVALDYPQSFEAKLTQGILINGEFHFSVQVGSYSKLENAQELVNELAQKGYKAYIVEHEADGLRFNRVRVGRCDTKDEAVSLESSLKNEGLPTKIFP